MNNSDRMDILLAAAARQGFQVWQTKTGTWVFRRNGVTISYPETPRTGRQWLALLGPLRGAGLIFPEEI